MNRIIFIISVFVITLLQCIVLQTKGESNVQFYNLNAEYGISFRETNDICGDQYGFIWVSSKMGIIRYTESDIRIYQLPYDSKDVIAVGLIFNNGELYAYSNNGQIFKYNLIQDKFELVINISKEIKNPYLLVKNLLVDNQSRIWIASSAGLSSYEKGVGLKSVIKNQSVQYIAWYDKTRFFYAIDGQIRLFNTEDLSNEIFQILPEDNNYFVFSNTTIYLYDAKNCV